MDVPASSTLLIINDHCLFFSFFCYLKLCILTSIGLRPFLTEFSVHNAMCLFIPHWLEGWNLTNHVWSFLLHFCTCPKSVTSSILKSCAYSFNFGWFICFGVYRISHFRCLLLFRCPLKPDGVVVCGRKKLFVYLFYCFHFIYHFVIIYDY